MLSRDKPCRKWSVLCKRVGEETVLYDKETEAIHVLNPTALLVWDLCDGKHSLEDMEMALRSEFSVADEERVGEHIRGVIGRFLDEGLLENP